MLRRLATRLLHFAPPANDPAVRAAPHRRRKFTFAAPTRKQTNDPYSRAQAALPADGVSPGSGGRVKSFSDSGPLPAPPRGVAKQLSQREEYRERRRAAAEAEADASHAHADGDTDEVMPGRLLAPLPSRFYSTRAAGRGDGIDAYGYEPTRPSRAERQRAFRETLESRGASMVDFTVGGEKDIDLGGLPEQEFHGRDGWTTIPQESSLFNTVHARGLLESRVRNNSWGVIRKQLELSRSVPTANTASGSAPGNEAEAEIRSLQRSGSLRQYHASCDGYQALFEDEGQTLEPTLESVGQPRSTYAMRKLYVDGLTGYQGMITKEEELHICDELLHALQSPAAAYIAEEARYCVNLYEQRLGVPGKDALAFSLEETCPTLHEVLLRFYHLGLIPSPPNVCQVSEFVGTFSGYPVHLKNPAVGCYVGLLNLVSTTVLHLQHVDCPWYPRVHMNPRSLFVVEQPCLGEYKMGYKRTHEPFHAFEYATRVSKDYRIEVLFATVETQQLRVLREATGITAYAAQRQEQQSARTRLPGATSAPTESHAGAEPPNATPSQVSGASTPPFSMDRWIETVRHRLEVATDGRASGEPAALRPRSPSTGAMEDVQLRCSLRDATRLREELVNRHIIGRRAKPFEVSSPAAPVGETCHTWDSNSRSSASTEPTIDTQKSHSSVNSLSGNARDARRRIEALKARHEFVRALQNDDVPRRDQGCGSDVLQGVGRVRKGL